VDLVGSVRSMRTPSVLSSITTMDKAIVAAADAVSVFVR
jgi:hypothetical protein